MTQVIKFGADFCKNCGVLSTVLKDRTYNEINIEEDIELASKYGVRNIPTTLFIKDGHVVERKVGVFSLEEFDKIVEKWKI